MVDIRKKAEIAEQNRKLALKLFTQQPTYPKAQFDQMHKQRKKQLRLLQRVEKVNVNTSPKPIWQSEFNLPPIKDRKAFDCKK